VAERHIADELSPARRQELKGRAHALDAVVLIGAAGLTPGVVAEIGRALDSHELIKIRLAGGDRAARERLLAEICGATGATPVQHIGKVIVIFRERVEEASPPLTPLKPAKRPRKAAPRRSGVKSPLSSRRPPSPRRGKLRPR